MKYTFNLTPDRRVGWGVGGETGREITESPSSPCCPCKHSPHAHPLPRHGVHGSSRLVQHICCWQRPASTYGSTLSLRAEPSVGAPTRNWPAQEWPAIRENCQQDHLRSQTASTDKCLLSLCNYLQSVSFFQEARKEKHKSQNSLTG